MPRIVINPQALRGTAGGLAEVRDRCHVVASSLTGGVGTFELRGKPQSLAAYRQAANAPRFAG